MASVTGMESTVMFVFEWRDLVALVVIVVVSYWIAFESGASKFFIQSKKKKPRGTITGDTKNTDFIQKVPRNSIGW